MKVILKKIYRNRDYVYVILTFKNTVPWINPIEIKRVQYRNGAESDIDYYNRANVDFNNIVERILNERKEAEIIREVTI